MYELLEDMIGNAINIFFDLDYNFYNFLNDTFLYIIFAVILIEGKNYIVKKNITSEIDAVLDDVEEKQIKASLKKIIKENSSFSDKQSLFHLFFSILIILVFLYFIWTFLEGGALFFQP